MSTTHFDIAMDKIRRAVQEYEDDWRKGLANSREIRDNALNKVAELKQEVERLTKESEKLALWVDRFNDASTRAFKAEQELLKLREHHAKVAKEHEELFDRMIATQRDNELNRLKAASQPCKTAGEPLSEQAPTAEQVRELSERLDWIEKRLAESGFKL